MEMSNNISTLSHMKISTTESK